MKIRARHHPERLERHSHRQFHDVRTVRQSMQYGVESIGHVGVADRQIDGQRRAVHVGIAGDVVQRVADRLGTAGRDGDRTEDVRVLSACKPEGEIRNPKLLCALSEQGGQRTERNEAVVGADHGRIDAHAVTELVGITPEFGDQLGQSRQRRSTDEIRHVSKCK
jgi:hypothetical protein